MARLQTVGGLAEDEAGCIYDFSQSDKVVLVGFGGLFRAELVGFGDADREGLDDAPVAVPFEFFNLVSAMPVARVFVRDLDQLFYQRGVRGLGPTVDDVSEGLAHLVSRFERAVFVGQSAGGYAAILMGSLLGADEVIAFSPQTFLSSLQRRLHHDDRWPEKMAEINHMHRWRRNHLDLRRVLRRQGNGARISVYYGAGNNLDRIHARRLEPIPGVSLHPQDTASHAVARRMREKGLLQPLLLRALDPDAGRVRHPRP